MGDCYVAVIDAADKKYKVGLFQSKTIDLVQSSVMTDEELVRFVVSNGYTPLNFSIDRRGMLKQDFGSFDRFHENGVAVVLAEYVSVSGKTMGYKLIHSKTGAVKSLRTADIVAWEKQAGRPFLQNGIVRNGTVNCYPLHKYPVIVLSTQKKKPAQKTQGGVSEQQPVKPVAAASSAAAKKVNYTTEQMKEFTMCRNHGVDTKFIENVQLSPKQMRVIWVSKSKGALAEYFNKPEYSVEAMKFYADRLLDTAMVSECMAMLKHPELTVDKLGELYLCVCEGVSYADLCDKSYEEINLARLQRSPFDAKTDDFDMNKVRKNAIRVTNKLKGLG